MKYIIGSILLLSLVVSVLSASTANPTSTAAAPNATAAAGDTLISCYACSMVGTDSDKSCSREPTNSTGTYDVCNVSQGYMCYAYKSLAAGQIGEFKRGCMKNCRASNGCINAAKTGECRQCCDTDDCNVGTGASNILTCNLLLVALALTLVFFKSASF